MKCCQNYNFNNIFRVWVGIHLSENRIIYFLDPFMDYKLVLEHTVEPLRLGVVVFSENGHCFNGGHDF